MKNSIKKIALLLAVLTCSSAFAATVSAKNIFVATPYDREDVEEVIETEPEKEEDESGYENYNGTPVYKASNRPFRKPNKFYREPVKVCEPVKYDYCDIITGGKYYSTADAKAELSKYFENNTETFFMYKGESRFFSDDAYFYSDDTSVVDFNYKTGELEAIGRGHANVYVYTKGGVPFFRLTVSVGIKTVNKLPDTLRVIPDDSNLRIGDVTDFTVKSSGRTGYDDIVLSITSGTGRASFNSDGELVAEANGAVMIHAESKSDPSVNGDCIIYIGDYRKAISAGCWKTCDGGIRVDKWCDTFYGNWFTRPYGWIKCYDGSLIPVVKFDDIEIEFPSGNVIDTTVTHFMGVADLDRVLHSYNEFDIVTVVNKYNLYKPGFFCPEYKLCWNDFDFRNFALSMLIKDILD